MFSYSIGRTNLELCKDRLLRKDDGQINPPTERTIHKILQTFKETGSIGDSVSRVHHCGVRAVENIATMNDDVAEDPELSIHRRTLILAFCIKSGT